MNGRYPHPAETYKVEFGHEGRQYVVYVKGSGIGQVFCHEAYKTENGELRTRSIPIHTARLEVFKEAVEKRE